MASQESNTSLPTAQSSPAAIAESSSKQSVLGDLVNHDWDSVRSFLRCKVRPGGDVSRIYRCNFCDHEFPNAQAFGGHMSSHSKTKKAKKPRKERSFPNSARGKPPKRPKSASPSTEIAQDQIGEEWFQYLNSDAE